MDDAIGGILPLAVGVAVSPLPIVGMVLVLLTPDAKPNGLSFLSGWILGLAGAGAVLLVVFNAIGAANAGAEPATWVSWLKFVLGLALLLLAVRQWQHRSHAADQAPMPKWMSALEGLSPARSAGLAVLLSAVNPKNLVLVVGGASVVAQAGLSVGGDVVAWAAFTVIGTIGVAAPLGIYLFLGDRAGTVLDGLKTWLVTNNTAVMAVLALVIGAKLLGDGITGIF